MAGAIHRRTRNGQSKRLSERHEEKARQITQGKEERKATEEEGTIKLRKSHLLSGWADQIGSSAC
jgi:hypothetical protein